MRMNMDATAINETRVQRGSQFRLGVIHIYFLWNKFGIFKSVEHGKEVAQDEDKKAVDMHIPQWMA